MKKGMHEKIHTCEMIAFSVGSCYTKNTFPPIFRDGVRGGSAASAFKKGVK